METREAVARFLAAKKSRRPKTVSNYTYTLHAFTEAFPELPITPEPIEAWLFRAEWKPATQLSYYGHLGVFYNWLVAEKARFDGQLDHLTESPMKHIERPIVPDEPPPILSAEELRHLLTHPKHSQRDRALLYFTGDTGWRLGEVANLEHPDIKDGFVVAHGGKEGGRFTPVSGLVREMLADLPRHPKHPEWVWWGLKGKLTADTIGHLITDCFRRAGFHGPRYSAHCLRHTFATLWEGDELVLQQILGHRKLDMVKRYRRFRLNRARAQHALYSPLAVLRESEQLQMAL